jgi:hypothetical protein
VRLFKSRQGLSTVIGGIFVVLITVSSLNAIFWMLVQQETLREVTEQMNRLDTERFSENLEFGNPALVNFTSSEAGYEFDVVVSNVGGVGVKVARIYIYSNSSDLLTVLDEQESPTVPGITNNFLDSGELEKRIHVKTDRNLNDGALYTVKLVTERGRIFTAEYQRSTSAVWASQVNLGPIRLDLTYTSVNYTSPSQTTPAPGWVVPGATPLVWYVKLTNIGPYELKLLKQSVFYAMEFKESGNPVPEAFFIVSPLTDYPGGTPGVVSYDEDNDPYILLPNAQGDYQAGGPPLIVKFSATEMGGDTPRDLSSSTRYIVFIGLYYEVNGEQMGVTIPFVAIRTT